MRGFLIPDLDLIKQAETGVRRFGRASPAILSGSTETATNAGDFAADLLQKSGRRRM